MAWPIPASAGVAWRSWDFIKQYYYAIRERYAAAGWLVWPRSAWIYDEGFITGITATSVTIDGKAWETVPPRWVGYDNSTGHGWEAANYDLIINDCDPRKVIRTAITAQPSGDTLTVEDMTQRVTERVTTSIASLVGRRGIIIKRGGIWWSDRWIEWPNDEIYADGITKTAAAGTLTAYGSLSSHILPGREVVFFNTLGVMQRGTVATRTGSTITFTGTSGVAVVDDAFAVVAVDGYFQFDRVAGRPKSYYRGAMESYYSHWPNDVLTATPKPAASIDFKFGKIPGSCPAFASSYLVTDVDLWVDQDEVCDFAADFTFAPNLYKTLRGLWDALFDVCVDFYDRDTDFDHALSMPLLVAATWLSASGINPIGGTAGTHTGTGLPVALSVPFVPIDVWFAVIGPLNQVQTFGKGTYDGTEIVGVFSSDDDGQAVVGSLGPTRWTPRNFRRMRDVTGFIPSVDAAPVWPPTESFPGVYITLLASTHYLESTDRGFIVEATRAEDAFADGDLACFIGDNWDDPTTGDLVGDGMDDLTPWQDRLFTGRRTSAIQSRIDSSRSGMAIDGSTSQLTSGFDWWGMDFWTPGAVYVRSGTATSGSTTTLADTAQTGSALFDDVTRNQAGMVLIVTRPSDSSLHKRLITAHAGTTLTFAPALPFAVAAGTAYAIRETDGVMNRWKGRGLKLSKPDPVTTGATLTATTTISGNDDATLFFAVIAWAVDNTTAFQIDDEPIGGVWLRNSGAWVVPTGNDPRSPNPPFRKSQTANAPTMVKRYGLPNLRDFVVLNNFVELNAGISQLKRTQAGGSWTSRLDDAVAEKNSCGGGDSQQGSLGDDKIGASNTYATTLANPALGLDTPPPPQVSARTSVDVDFDDAEHARIYAYMVTNLQGPSYCPVTREGYDFYVYGGINVLDPPLGGTDPVYYFDDNGDAVSYHEWRRFDSGSGSGLIEKSMKFGSLTEPNWPPVPGNPPHTTVSGYYILATNVVVNWSFTYD